MEHDLAGQRIGETWELETPLGEGGMGTVWLARHTRVPSKRAAVKVLRAGGAVGEEVALRFRREAEIAARLEHPHIVQVYDAGTLPDGAPYIVMEYLRGETLKARLGRGPLALAPLQALVHQLCSALWLAHQRGVVHRDLKPDNVFLVASPHGEVVKVLDFGISKLEGGLTVQTSDSVLLGTPLYMSPEQASGENTALTARSDLFSLGVLCYEALTGAAPFRGENLPATVYRILHHEPAPLPALPPTVWQGLAHALAKRPADRTPDAATFALEFTGRPLEAAQTPARHPGAVTVAGRPRPPVRAGPRWWPLALTIAAGVSLWALWPRTAPESVPERSPDAHRAQASGTEALAPTPRPTEEGNPTVGTGALPPAQRATETERGSAALLQADAGAPPTRHPPAPPQPRAPAAPLDDEQRATLAQAQRAFDRGDFPEALAFAIKPAAASTAPGRALITEAACALGNLGLANATLPQVAGPDTARVRSFCKAHGADLP